MGRGGSKEQRAQEKFPLIDFRVYSKHQLHCRPKLNRQSIQGNNMDITSCSYENQTERIF